MDKDTHIFRDIRKSKFVRSFFLRALSIILIVSIAIVVIVFFSFSSEINRNIISDRQQQLAALEDTISKRMEEISSIAYNVSTDPTFHLEPVDGVRYSGYEMSNTLARYLVGNSFIEHLAYYRLSEPDKIYVSSGERSFSEFWSTNFGMDKATAEKYIREIQGISTAEVRPISFGENGKTYFSYLCPIPQFSANPQALILMLISLDQVEPLLDPLLMNSKGEIIVFDADGDEIYRVGGLEEAVPIDLSGRADTGEEEYVTVDGTKYVIQKQSSAINGWTFVAVIQLKDIISGLAGKQLIFILLLLGIMLAAIFAMVISIAIQYKPIRNLAAAVTDSSREGGDRDLIDERVLLSSAIATLQDDSQQKRKFETAYLEAEAANKAKSAFLSSMSHDIRTPMNAIIGMTALAYKHAEDPDYVRECLQKAQVASRYLLDIINNVLDMSRIESGRVVLSEEVISLPELVRGIVTILSQSAEARGQELMVRAEGITNEKVIGDSVRLTQVLVNILSNSVKFTPEGGTISLHMRQLEPADPEYGDYVFTCADTGIGMAPEFVKHVFDTFSRAKDVDAAKVEGTGLGMAIAKNLVELMGGTIECESQPGQGTTFTVSLHMKLAPAGSEGAAPTSGLFDNPASLAHWETDIINLEGRRVLVAEDNSMNREIARKIIGETKAEVISAANGKEAVDAFSQRPPGYFDVILMDLHMPVMNGYEATAAIRSMEREDGATVPIYAMTASAFDEDVRRVKEAGMNGHIGKPYTPQALYKLLRQALLL